MLKSFRNHSKPSIPAVVDARPEPVSAPPQACAIRVVDSDDRLSNIAADDFNFGGVQSPLALAFISPHVDFSRVTSALQRVAGATPVIAVSTAGELCGASSGPLYKPTGNGWSSVIIEIFPADLFATISIHGVPLHNEDIRKGDPSKSHETRIDAIARSLSQVMPPFAIDVRDTIALTLVDGLSASENYFMEAVYRTGKFPCAFVGGSAGGKLDFRNTHLFDGRRILENHAIVAFLKLAPGRAYSVFKTQNFRKAGHSFVVMDADPNRRTVSGVLDTRSNEIRPFASMLAETLKTTPANLQAKMSAHSFGIEAGGELFVRSVAGINAETGVVSFFCDVNAGDKLELLQATDLVDQTKRDLAGFLRGKPPALGALSLIHI